MDSTDECSICLQDLFKKTDLDFSPPASKRSKQHGTWLPTVCGTPCGHKFHRDCLMQWLDYGVEGVTYGWNGCPQCRTEVAEWEVYPVYPTMDDRNVGLQANQEDNDYLEDIKDDYVLEVGGRESDGEGQEEVQSSDDENEEQNSSDVEWRLSDEEQNSSDEEQRLSDTEQEPSDEEEEDSSNDESYEEEEEKDDEEAEYSSDEEGEDV